MQTNNTLILALEEFSVLKDNKFSKAKFLIKLKKALTPKTLLIFINLPKEIIYIYPLNTII